MIRAAMVLAFAVVAGAQQARFEDVVRNLRNPDPDARLNAIRLLREARYPEAAAPVAALVTDPVEAIQLEAIAAELSFFLVEDLPERRRVALVVEVRNAGRALSAFEAGPLAVWPRPVPPEVVAALLQAVDDDQPRVRLQAIYALGAIARPPLADAHAQQVIKALDHYDPQIRIAAARVAGRLQVATAADALIKAVNDSNSDVRYAAMHALGEIHEVRAVQALTEQLAYYKRGPGAYAALNGLARIGHASSVPLFTERLTDKDPYLRRAAAEGLGRAGDPSPVAALEQSVGTDGSEMVRAAMAFALQKLGRNYVARMAEFLASVQVAPQVIGYLVELGPAVAPTLTPHLKDPNERIRMNTAHALGLIGGDAAIAALQPLTQDRDKAVVEAATRAIERIKMGSGKV